jgi:hypothetical protein
MICSISKVLIGYLGLSIEEGFWWQVLVVPARGCCLLLPLLHPLTAQFSHWKTGIDPSVLDQILNLHSPCDEIAPPASMGTTTTTSSNFSTKSSLVLKLFHPKKRLSQQLCHLKHTQLVYVEKWSKKDYSSLL